MRKKSAFISLTILLFFVITGRCFSDVSAKFKQAQTHEKQKQYKEAEQIYQQIVTDHPGTEDAFRAQKSLAVLYVAWNKLQQADSALQELLGRFPGHKGLPQAVNYLANNYAMKLKRYDKARELHQYVLDHFPRVVEAMWAQRGLASADIRTGHYAGAEAAIEKLKSDYPEHRKLAEAFYRFGNEYYSMAQYKKALECYKYVLDRWPKSDYALKSQKKVAGLNMELGRAAAARSAVDRLFSDFSAHKDIAKEVRFLADQCCNKQRLYFTGLPSTSKKVQAYAVMIRTLCEHVLSKWPDSEYAFGAQRDLARAHIHMKDFEAAQAAVEKLRDHYPDHNDLPETLYLLGNDYRRAKGHKQACRLYKHVASRWPQSEQAIWAQRDLAISNIVLGDSSGAEAAVEKLLAEFSGRERIAEAVNQIAEKYRKQKTYDQACRLYKSVLEKWPESEQAMWAQAGIASVDISKRDDASARAATKKLLDNYKDHKDLATARFQLGSDYCRAGKYKEAQELYKQIAEEHPGSEVGALARVGLGKIKLCLGGDKDARAIFDRVLADYAGRPILLKATEMMASAYYNEALRKKKQDLDEQAKSYYQKTIVEFKRIMPQLPETDDKAAEICYFCGVCYDRLAEHDKAMQYYRKVVDNWPEYKLAWSAQFRIVKMYKQLIRAGVMSDSESEAATKVAFERLIESFPDCPAASAARKWLSYYHKKSSEGGKE